MNNLEELVETLSKLTVMDMAKLKELLEEKWGVSAAAPVAVAAAPGAEPAPEAKVESTEFEVSLIEVPADKKIAAIKALREITALGLKEVREMISETPKVVKESVNKAEADEIKKKLEEAGAKVAVKGL